jgi:hypothetical protein
MQLNNAQDHSTQAMTEVSLALSMAFFSLLLVALISIGVPESADAEQIKAVTVPEFVLTETSSSAKDTQAENEALATQYIFYFDSKLYDQHLKDVAMSKLDTMQKLVIAMPTDTDVSQALALQKQFRGFDLSLTIMDDKWLAAFENSIKI